MTLIKTSLLNAIAVVIKMLTLLGINKLLAVYVGPTGYAALGQFQNVVQMITTFASGAINTGVIKYTAEFHSDEAKQHKVWRTAGSIALLGSLFTAVVIFSLSKPLANWFLPSEDYSGVFKWFAITLVFFTFNTLLLAILNGKREIVRYVIANIAGSIFALLVTVFLVIQFGLYGALVALVVYQSLSFVVTLLLCYKASWFSFGYLLGGIDRITALNLAKYTAMALTSAACAPISHILVRNHLGESFGWEAAGYWEAMCRLSGAYLMLITTTLSVYYLPRLSELQNWSDIKKEILQGYTLILPVAALSGLIIFIARDFVINVLFTSNFSPMRDLFAWQMLGDTLKIGGWMLAYVMLGKSMVKRFLYAEVFFSISYVLLVYFLCVFFGLQGAVIAYAVNYFMYWVAMYFMIFKF